MRNLDKYRGCLIGGAVGDALGYAVEFKKIEEIQGKYGENGITEQQLINGKARISDETQLTLFTAVGLLVGKTRGRLSQTVDSYSSYLATCYSEWLYTQQEDKLQSKKTYYTWLCNIPGMYSRRAPDNTNISAIYNGEIGSMEEPINSSNSCGAIIRVSPIGLCFDTDEFTLDEINTIGLNSALITHGHPLGYIPCVALVDIIHIISHNNDIKLLDAILDMKQRINDKYKFVECVENSQLKYFTTLIDRAIDLVDKEVEDVEAIQMLGRGRVAEETLAIAVYCSLKYEDDFEKAIIAAANHTGESDATASVTGNILGTYLGYNSIPSKFIDNLEFKNIIMEIAEDLYNSTENKHSDKNWEDKYIYATYMSENTSE